MELMIWWSKGAYLLSELAPPPCPSTSCSFMTRAISRAANCPWIKIHHSVLETLCLGRLAGDPCLRGSCGIHEDWRHPQVCVFSPSLLRYIHLHHRLTWKLLTGWLFAMDAAYTSGHFNLLLVMKCCQGGHAKHAFCTYILCVTGTCLPHFWCSFHKTSLLLPASRVEIPGEIPGLSYPRDRSQRFTNELIPSSEGKVSKNMWMRRICCLGEYQGNFFRSRVPSQL